MRLDDERESTNVEDMRGRGGGFPTGGGIRIGGIGAIVLIAGALLFGVDPRIVLGLLEGGPAPQQQVTQGQGPAGQGRNDPQRQFVSRILASTEDVWTEQFRAMGRRYQDPQLVLFSGATQSGCGVAQTAVGPFYCPNDQKVYLDLDFFQELQNRMGAGGEFARAYVIAHEIGHHVQNQLGTLGKVDQVRPQLSQVDQNQLSVRVELQADCYAGVWANHADREKRILEQGDVESGLNAAAAVGDDRLQRAARGTVAPDSFTHGSSAQRVSWFRRGLQTGDINQCNTFTAQ
jgi:predicted metalloprotease